MCRGKAEKGGPRRCSGHCRENYAAASKTVAVLEKEHAAKGAATPTKPNIGDAEGVTATHQPLKDMNAGTHLVLADGTVDTITSITPDPDKPGWQKIRTENAGGFSYPAKSENGLMQTLSDDDYDTVRAASRLRSFEDAGYAASKAGQPGAPALNPMVQQELDGKEVGDPDNIAVMKAYSRGYERRVGEEAASIVAEAEQHKAGQQMLAKTRGSYADRPDAAETVEGTFRNQLQSSGTSSFKREEVWNDKSVHSARALYGPGTTRTALPASYPEPAAMTDEDLQNLESDVFYIRRSGIAQHPQRGIDADRWTIGARREMNERGLGPKNT